MICKVCKICKVFSINFILIRCGSVKYNCKTENVFVVCHMIRHTAKDFAVCHSMGHTAKLAEAAAGDARRQAAASTPRQAAGPAAAPRPLLCRVPDRGAHGKGGSFAAGQIWAHSKAPAPYPL